MEGKRKRGRCQMTHKELGMNRGAASFLKAFPPSPVQINARHLSHTARPFSPQAFGPTPSRNTGELINKPCLWLCTYWPFIRNRVNTSLSVTACRCHDLYSFESPSVLMCYHSYLHMHPCRVLVPHYGLNQWHTIFFGLNTPEIIVIIVN